MSRGGFRYALAAIVLVGGVALVAVWWLTRLPDPTSEYAAAQRELDAADASQEAGDFLQAMTHAARARDAFDALRIRFPDDPAARRGLARAEFRLGRGYFSYGFPAASEAFFAQAEKALTALRAAAPGDAELDAEMLELTDWRADAWDLIGWEKFTPELRATTAAGWKALAARPDAEPHWLANHGKTLEKEADALYAVAEAATAAARPTAVAACRARYDDATDHYRRASRAEPGNVKFKLRLLGSSLSTAELLALAGDPPGVAAQLPPLEALAAELLAAHPGRADVLRADLRTRQDRARYHQLVGTPEDLRTAMAMFAELAGNCRDRIAAFPKHSAWVTQAVEQAQNAGKVAFLLKDWKAARGTFGQAVATWEAHPDRFPADQIGTWYLDLVAHLAVAHGELGDGVAVEQVTEKGRQFATARGLGNAAVLLAELRSRAAAANR